MVNVEVDNVVNAGVGVGIGVEVHTLKEAEAQLEKILDNTATLWGKSAAIIMQVKQQELWQNDNDSFSQWLRRFATKKGVSVSYLWKINAMGTHYLKYLERKTIQAQAENKELNVPKLNELEVDLVSLELATKLAGKSEEKQDELFQDVLNGTKKRSELASAWRLERSMNPNKVKKTRHEDKSEINSNDPIENETNDVTITAVDIVFALSKAKAENSFIKFVQAYSPKVKYKDLYEVLTEFPVKTGTTHNARRIDCLIVTNRDTENKNYDLTLHGIEIKVSKSDLENDYKMDEYKQFVDYFYIAIPNNQEMIDIALNEFSEDSGVLVVDEVGKIEVIRPAELQKNSFMKIDTLKTIINKVSIR